MKKVFAIIMALICCGNLVTEVGAMNLNIIEKENISQDYYEYNGFKLTYHSSTINNFGTREKNIFIEIYMMDIHDIENQMI